MFESANDVCARAWLSTARSGPRGAAVLTGERGRRRASSDEVADLMRLLGVHVFRRLGGAMPLSPPLYSDEHLPQSQRRCRRCRVDRDQRLTCCVPPDRQRSAPQAPPMSAQGRQVLGPLSSRASSSSSTALANHQDRERSDSTRLGRCAGAHPAGHALRALLVVPQLRSAAPSPARRAL